MIQPIRDNVLVKCFQGDEMSEGGIVVPESFRKESNKVTVVAVGKGTEKEEMNLKPGMIGFRVKDWGTEIDYCGERFYMMRQKDIIATLQ